MIDIEHKVLSVIKDNIENIKDYLNDKKNAKALMSKSLTIDSWTRMDRVLLYQSITNEVLDKYDINEFVAVIKSIRFLGYSDDIDLDMFKAVVENSKDFIMDSDNIRQPLKTNSNLSNINFDVSLMQMAFSDNEDDIYARIYFIKTYYLDSLNDLFLRKEFLHKKAYLNDTLRRVVCEEEDNYFVTQLYFALNGILKPLKPKKKKDIKTEEIDSMQLVLKDFN